MKIILPAQDLQVDVSTQYQLYRKALTFDRAFINRIGRELVMGVLYRPSLELSCEVKDEWIKAVVDNPPEFRGLPIQLIALGATDERELEKMIVEQRVDVLYVAPLEDFDINAVTRICQRNRVSSVTGVPQYAASGIAVSFERNGSNPRLLINLKSAKVEGANFSSILLGMARVLEETTEPPESP